MLEDVKRRLESFGYTATDADGWALGFVIDKVTSHIKNSCNIVDIPDGLKEIAVDMVAGEFLKGKKGTGQLDESELLASDAVSQIKLGDTNVQFDAAASASVQLDSLIAHLLRGYTADLVTYRRLKW